MDERAFTLIELLVVMVISTIVIGAIVAGVLTGLRGSNKLEVDRKAIVEFDQARELLERDLRATRAPGRDYDLITNRQDLRDAVLTGTSALPASLDIADIKTASATQLAFVADVVHENPAALPESECVWWRIRSAGGSWWLERSVGAYTPSCASPPNGAYVIKPQRISSVSPVPTSLFSYVRTCEASACGVGTCRGAPPVPSVAGIQRNWITEVRLDLSNVLTRADQASKGELIASVAIRNRTSDDYLYALGCSEQS